MHIETTFTQYCLVTVINKLTYKQSLISSKSLHLTLSHGNEFIITDELMQVHPILKILQVYC